MYHIKFEPTAIADMALIFEYYFNQGGLPLAEKIESRIFTQIDTLQFMPDRCMNSVYFPHTKELVIERLPYKVYFIIDEDDKTVSILNIIHTSRNIEDLL